jgi:hypothetical protein
VVTSNSLTPVEEEVREYREHTAGSSSSAPAGSEEAPLRQFVDYEYRGAVANEVRAELGGGCFGHFG